MMKTETVHQLGCVHLQNTRPIWVWQPAEPSEQDSLVVFLDGEFYLERVAAPSLKQAGPDWFVFVSMASVEARWRECPCHSPFAAFIAGELLPWLEAEYPAIRKVRQRVLVGLSYTGLAAAYVALEAPGLFQKVISQSGSFWWKDGWLTGQFAGLSQPVPTEFYLEVGLRETQENVRHREDVLQVISQIDGVRRFRDMLLEKGYTVRYAEFDGGHDFLEWQKTLPQALAWALLEGQG